MPSKHITYNTCLNEAYLQGFFETLDTLLSKQEKKEEKQRAEAVESPNNEKRDQLVPIYMYCKNLWDKWLIHPNDDGVDVNNNPYTVKKFFKNFLFIDSFYRNIYNLLPVNCQKFMDIVDGLSDRDTSDNTSLYSFIGNFAKLHKCLFVAIPDYINLGSVDNDGKMQQEGINNMTKLFKCIPHNEMRSIQTDNKFIVIYTHEPSKNQDDNRGFANDSISICDSDGNLTEEAKELFGGITPPQNVDGSNNKISTDNMDTPAYPIPSFAVAFSGHNNHIFKAVDVNMDNPIATEHSINILSYIAQLGSGNGQKVAYQGQDVFPIFSNYAYQSTITMMGNAQIQPLMYYQLMNIPMWKGAYMIFNVKHNIVPGNMTTTFTGMKMSKNCVPFLEKWVYPVECVVPQPTAIAAPTTTETTTPNNSDIIVTASGEAFVGEVPIINDKYRVVNGMTCQEWMNKFAPGCVLGTTPSSAVQAATTEKFKITNRLGQNVKNLGAIGPVPQMNKYLIPILLAAIDEINKIETFTLLDVQTLRGYTRNKSRHSFGIAIDFNKVYNGYYKQNVNWPSAVNPQYNIIRHEDQIGDNGKAQERLRNGTFAKSPNFKVVQIMAKYGFAWGGSYADYMHFSYITGH